MALKDLLPTKPRRTVLGIPVGKTQTDWGRVAKGAVSIGSGVYAAARARKKAGSNIQKGKEVLRKGGDTLKKAEGAASTVSSAASAASGAKTPIGKAVKVAMSLGGGQGGGDEHGGGGRPGQGHEQSLKFYIEEHIDVGAPRGVVYDQWTQFEDFASIFKGVEGVEQEDDETTRWQAKIGPSRRQWKAEITEQIRPKRIVWRSTGGTDVRGVVTFHSIDDELTRVMVQMLYHPRGFVEHVGNWFRAARRRTRKDLKLFKNFVEVRREPTGAWRGEIRSDAGRGEAALQPADAQDDVSRKPSRDERIGGGEDTDGDEERGGDEGRDERSGEDSRSQTAGRRGSGGRASNGDGSNGRSKPAARRPSNGRTRSAARSG